MHKVNRTCPICKQNGKNTPLELRQINLTEAVYICEDRNCIYPIGFQWEYVKSNILDDSDDSSDDNIKLTSDLEITSSNQQTNTLKDINSICNNSNKLLHEKHKNITNEQSIKQDKVNIISNVVIENPEYLQSIIKTKDSVKTNEIAARPTESIRKINARINNKTKTQNVSGAIPESVVKNAKALSKYFSSTTNQSKKPKTNIKSVFDIIQQPPIKKQDKVLSEKSRDLILTSIEHNYSAKKDCDEVSSDNKYIDSFLDEALTNPQEKLNKELTDTFDEFLFSNDDKCDTKNQSLDLSEMDELLSFL